MHNFVWLIIFLPSCSVHETFKNALTPLLCLPGERNVKCFCEHVRLILYFSFICLFAFLNLFLLLRCESAFVLWNFNLQMFQSIARKALRKNFDFLLQFFVPAFFHYHLVEVHWSLKSERGISWVHTVHSKFTYITYQSLNSFLVS